MDDAILAIEKYKDKEIFIIGGETIYKMFIDIVDKIYLTIVDIILDGDVFFPNINYNDWDIVLESSNNNNKYSFKNYILIKKK